MPEFSSNPSGRASGYIILDGQRLNLASHPTDFLVDEASPILGSPAVKGSRPVTRGLLRVQASRPAETAGLMQQARQHGIAHPVYINIDTGEELLIDDRIALELSDGDPARLDEISQEFHLVQERRVGAAHILRVSSAAGLNPLETANRIAALPGVRSCHPQILVEQQYHSARQAPR